MGFHVSFELWKTMSSIAVIDDNPVSLALSKRTLSRAGFTDIRGYTDPLMALTQIRENPPSVVLVDYVMPNLDGLEFLLALQREGISAKVPVALMSESAQVELIRLDALQAGAIEVMHKPLNFQEVALKLRNLGRIALSRRSANLQTNGNTTPSDNLRSDVASGTRQTILHPHQLLANYLKQIASIRDEPTGHHTSRIADFSVAIAEAYGLDPDTLADLRMAAPLHDIGKIAIKDQLLFQTGAPLEDYEVGKLHTVLGYQILAHKAAEDECPTFIELAAQIALSHHEKWDGTGYPNQFTGELIPVAARIVALADSFDCLSTYGQGTQKALMDKAQSIILSNSGTWFDPLVVEAFSKVYPNILSIKRLHDGEEVFGSLQEGYPSIIT